MGPSLYFLKHVLCHTVHKVLQEASYHILTAVMSSPLHVSFMCRSPDTILKFCLELEPIVISPYYSIYSIGPNLRTRCIMTCRSLWVFLNAVICMGLFVTKAATMQDMLPSAERFGGECSVLHRQLLHSCQLPLATHLLCSSRLHRTLDFAGQRGTASQTAAHLQCASSLVMSHTAFAQITDVT